MTLKFSKRQKSICGRAAYEKENSSYLAVTACYVLGRQGTKLSGQRSNTACYGKTPERQLQDNVKAIYGINLEIFLTFYLSVASQVWHPDISALHRFVCRFVHRNALILFTLVYV